IEFDQSLTVDELEDAIRERQNADYFEGRAVHPFVEITSILEYVPEGYELDADEERSSDGGEEGLEDIPDFEEDESLEEDETMRWDEDEEAEGEEEGDDEESEGEDDDEDDDDEEEEESDEEEKSPRGRR
ncbi:MAG TPA: hypothetical protein PKI32_05855, partial [Opitutales bacterium]|nr:hypothetical protein [Opitutales bacterium]